VLAVIPQTDVLHGSTTVERITLARFSGMRQEWNDLVRSSKSDCLFLTWEWLYTWWVHLAENRELRIVAIRCGDTLVALAPLALRPRSLARILPEAELLGSGFAGSDYLDVIVREGFELDVARMLSSELSKWRVTFKWINLRCRECEAERVASHFGQLNWNVIEATTNVCPYIPLEGHTWDTYLAILGPEHRYGLNRKVKRIYRDFAVRLEQASTETQCREGIDRLIELHNLRRRDRGGSDAFHTNELVQFHETFAPLTLERGWLRLFTLWLNDRPVASLYGFLYNKKFYFFQSGLHPDFEKQSVGLVVMGMAIKQAIEEGAEEFDFLHGDESYKKHWAPKKRELSRLELYPPTSLGWVSHSSREFVRSARSRFTRYRAWFPAAKARA
jgi:CelD/BcsL family acetyltransferase involved in cellulose biosynthesis